MAKEIERKFLVKDTSWRSGSSGVLYRQGYLNRDPERTVRVRIAGDAAFLTVKGATAGYTRAEFEYAIPREDAEALMNLCDGPLIEKTRYIVRHAGKTWEVDEFHGDNCGLVLAEIELEDDGEVFDRPSWLGDEVSHDPRYFNSRLAADPFSNWKNPAGTVR